MIEIEQIGDCVLYRADCLDVLPLLSSVDATIVDPPYGINGSISNSRARKGKQSKGRYGDSFEDTPENIVKCIVPAIKKAILLSERAAVTPGSQNLWEYPKPKHVGSFQYPASDTISCWGRMAWQPILYYGKDPWPGTLKLDSRLNCTDSERNVDHPCPKPLKQWSWLVARASLPQETVLDPFMGSGTTGVACVNLNRKFIGIELDQKYFDIACKRIEDAVSRPRFDLPEHVKPKQEVFDLTANRETTQ